MWYMYPTIAIIRSGVDTVRVYTRSRAIHSLFSDLCIRPLEFRESENLKHPVVYSVIRFYSSTPAPVLSLLSLSLLLLSLSSKYTLI